ncbi:MAG TPA: hypothetical protein VM598_03380, partial [Bdellovibrionota bacterium]|nr:hypothetical protein [Bdellovibrionota bacterium]
GAELLLIELKSRDTSCQYDYRLVELGPRSTGRIRWTEEFGNCGKISSIQWGAQSRFRFDEFTDGGGKKIAVKHVTYDIDDGSLSQ